MGRTSAADGLNAAVAVPLLPSFQAAPATPSLAACKPPRQRDRIFELSPNLHCSLVGTCLTTSELRQFLGKLGHSDARSATAHAIHHRAVEAAGCADLSGKLLNKLLDKKHATFVKRFARAKTVGEVADLWRETFASGDIPGAYWAVMTHPATNDALVREAFGEVHMLSHLVGTSNRVDLSRLSRLEADLAERDETIGRQEARLRAVSLELAERSTRIEALETALAVAKAHRGSRPAVAQPERDASADALALTQERLARALEDLRTVRGDLHAAGEQARQMEEREREWDAERAALQSLVAALSSPSETAIRDLGGARVLYVGGRPGQVDQLRALTTRFGGTFLSHDGGVEDSSALLAGLVSKADVALFPVDCISHHAAGQVKKICGDIGKPFVPLRTASVASYAAALATLRDAGRIGAQETAG